ncbi:hypothetical protein M427DRAFT_51498 [Gonapodya prolifera JEL478]|uniref:C2H2-type domain-containing protein n=1 Tax=Gonapodya prolifera (strain JEL478) TaxID=1344416 RepID=A0A139AX13_GONPJ|nr:hypothetical protein M427DRAFT_51498 [Gonapodya prolifera JEL478]|eukprot:KXS21247.1 hypothetical protein M427DRAFT_51498 [Gonapodya prolifera JEL478]
MNPHVQSAPSADYFTFRPPHTMSQSMLLAEVSPHLGLRYQRANFNAGMPTPPIEQSSFAAVDSAASSFPPPNIPERQGWTYPTPAMTLPTGLPESTGQITQHYFPGSYHHVPSHPPTHHVSEGSNWIAQRWHGAIFTPPLEQPIYHSPANPQGHSMPYHGAPGFFNSSETAGMFGTPFQLRSLTMHNPMHPPLSPPFPPFNLALPDAVKARSVAPPMLDGTSSLHSRTSQMSHMPYPPPQQHHLPQQNSLELNRMSGWERQEHPNGGQLVAESSRGHSPIDPHEFQPSSNTSPQRRSQPMLKKRRFKCNIGTCTYAFQTKWALGRHQRIHLNIRPYSCPIPGCTATFHRLDSMNSHHRGHVRRIAEGNLIENGEANGIVVSADEVDER